MNALENRILSPDRPRVDWRSIKINKLVDVKKALVLKHGSVTDASRTLAIPYNHLSDIVNGRRHYPSFVAIIQNDLQLSDTQVLRFWPLLGVWPKASRKRAV